MLRAGASYIYHIGRIVPAVLEKATLRRLFQGTSCLCGAEVSAGPQWREYIVLFEVNNNNYNYL